MKNGKENRRETRTGFRVCTQLESTLEGSSISGEEGLVTSGANERGFFVVRPLQYHALVRLDCPFQLPRVFGCVSTCILRRGLSYSHQPVETF